MFIYIVCILDLLVTDVFLYVQKEAKEIQNLKSESVTAAWHDALSLTVERKSVETS